MSKLLSVVVSVYNEEPGLREFYEETGKILKALPKPWDYELLFINDGSADGSLCGFKGAGGGGPEGEDREFFPQFRS